MEGVATQTEFGFSEAALSLPTHCRRQPVERFAVERIVLAKGSLDTPQREAFVRQVSEAYPRARTEEKLGVPHNRIEIPGKTALERIARGKRTLVFGSISPKNAVWERELRNNVFDHEWALSVYGFCPYNCAYCYLAALPGVWFSPAVRIYVNLAEIIAEVSRRAMAAGRRTTFYQGTLQDGLALDPLTAYSTVLVPFFAEHRHARAFVQTKSANIERLLHLRHNAHTALSWTLSPRPIAERFETNAPSVDARLAAMERCANAGYPVCANFIPVIPYGDWEALYLDLAREVLERVPLNRLTLGGACMKQSAVELLEARKGKENPISAHLTRHRSRNGEEEVFYFRGFCDRLYGRIARYAERSAPCRAMSNHRQGGTLALSFRRNNSFDLFPE